MAAKRPLQEDRLLPAEVKAKTYIQTELPFKAKTLHEKTSHSCKQRAAGSREGDRQGLPGQARQCHKRGLTPSGAPMAGSLWEAGLAPGLCRAVWVHLPPSGCGSAAPPPPRSHRGLLRAVWPLL